MYRSLSDVNFSASLSTGGGWSAGSSGGAAVEASWMSGTETSYGVKSAAVVCAKHGGVRSVSGATGDVRFVCNDGYGCASKDGVSQCTGNTSVPLPPPPPAPVVAALTSWAAFKCMMRGGVARSMSAGGQDRVQCGDGTTCRREGAKEACVSPSAPSSPAVPGVLFAKMFGPAPVPTVAQLVGRGGVTFTRTLPSPGAPGSGSTTVVVDEAGSPVAVVAPGSDRTKWVVAAGALVLLAAGAVAYKAHKNKETNDVV